MQDVQPLSKELHDKTITVISKKALELILEKKVPYSQVRNMAEFITDGIPEVKTNNQYLNFLDDVLLEFPFLINEVKILRGELSNVKEKQVISKLQSYIKNLTPN